MNSRDNFMSHNDAAGDWVLVHRNPTYRRDALPPEIGLRIKWHSPEDERSSQVFCISAFGGLWQLGDGVSIFNRLLSECLPQLPRSESWNWELEYIDRSLLGETGQGMPSNIDVFCHSPKAVVCIESKFLFDAKEGFDSCGQVKAGDCAGFYGLGSDLKTQSDANCRLEIKDGKRDPRLYWELGREYFLEDIVRPQNKGERCPFADSAYQLMRNFVFASVAAGKWRDFSVLAIVPAKTGELIKKQVEIFRDSILLPKHRQRIGFATYNQLAQLMIDSPHERSRDLGKFLNERMATLL